MRLLLDTVTFLWVLAALRLASLPAHHRDPFDRMLICQAIEDQFVIVTPDEAIHRYPIKILW